MANANNFCRQIAKQSEKEIERAKTRCPDLSMQAAGEGDKNMQIKQGIAQVHKSDNSKSTCSYINVKNNFCSIHCI